MTRVLELPGRGSEFLLHLSFDNIAVVDIAWRYALLHSDYVTVLVGAKAEPHGA